MLKICKCINHYVGIDVKDVPVKYVGILDFYYCIKHNYSLDLEFFTTDQIKERYAYLCQIVNGLYKWQEKIIYIKQQFKYDFSILLVELLHSKSITQGNNNIQLWIREGLPHFLAKVLCRRCNFVSQSSGYVEYVQFWENIAKRHGFEFLKSILYEGTLQDLKNTLSLLFNYDEESNILEVPFQKISKELSF